MKNYLLVFLMMVVTFGVRYPVLALVGRYNLPASVQRALRFVPVAVLSAIAAPMVLVQDGSLEVSFTNVHLLASVVAIVVAWKTHHLLLTIVIGMAVFVLLRLSGLG